MTEIRFTKDVGLFKPGDVIEATEEHVKIWMNAPGTELVQPEIKEIKPEPELPRQEIVKTKEETTAEYQIKKDIDAMECRGTFDDPNRTILLDQYEVFEKNSKGEPTGHINCPKLANLILEEDDRHYLVIQDNQEILWYNGSYYEHGGERIIEQRTNYYLSDKMSTRNKQEVLTYIKTKEYIKRDELEPPLNLINLKNGVFDIETKKLIPHSPNYKFLNQVPANYNPEAKINKLQTFFDETLDVNDLPLMQEFFGDCLQRAYRYKRALMCVGERDTGKSVMLNIIEKFLGKENTSNVNLWDLCTDRFATMELYKKLANPCSELDPQEITHIDKFLAITGDDWLSGQKKFQDRFKFKNYAKLIFFCNKIPDTKNKNEAFYVRWIVIVFGNQIPFENQIDGYYEQLCTEEELSGLFNWALEGLYRLKKQHRYSEHRTLEQIRDIMQKGNNPIREFVDQYIIVDPSGETNKEEMYLSYVEFCKNLGYPYKADNVFSRFFKPELPHGATVIEGQPRKNGHKKTWKGITCTYSRIGDLLTLDNYDNNSHDRIEGTTGGQ